MLGLDRHDFAIVASMVIVLVVVGVMKERGRDIVGAIFSRGAFMRLCALALPLTAIIIFGAYGTSYTPVDPMYAQF